MIGSDVKNILEIEPSRMSINASPRLKFNKFLFPLRLDNSTILKKNCLFFMKSFRGEESCKLQTFGKKERVTFGSK